MASSLISLAILILLIFLCVRGIMWGASLIVLLQGGFSCLVIGLVLLFSLPADGQVVGPNLPYLPVSVSALIFLSAVLSIVIAQKNQNVASGQHNKAGMAILAVGFALWAIGVIAFCLFVFGELPGGPDPKAAVITFSTLTLAGAVSLYFSTRYETVRFPNIYRWLTFWASIFMLSAILACSMIFIYAFPGDQPVAHTFWASLNSLNYVPMALLFIGLNQGYVKRKRVDKIIEPAADASEFIFEQIGGSKTIVVAGWRANQKSTLFGERELPMSLQEMILDPPVRGQWAIYNPPDHPGLVFDFLAVDERKSLYRKGNFLKHCLTFISVEDTYTWASSVFSPVDGVVVASHDSEEDRKRLSFVYDLLSLLTNKTKIADGFGAFGGNRVMIRSGEVFVLLCHLKHGSSKVRTGDTVRVGQPVAEVGNSGASIQPHLHLQVMSSDRYFPLFANLLPFKFSRGKVKQKGRWSPSREVELINRMHYWFEDDGA